MAPVGGVAPEVPGRTIPPTDGALRGDTESRPRAPSESLERRQGVRRALSARKAVNERLQPASLGLDGRPIRWSEREGARTGDSGAGSMRLSLEEERPRGARDAGARPGPSDEALVALARGGDSAAFDELVRRHFARLHALLFRLVGNHEDAEDLAQECFVRCHRAMAWFRGDGAFTTWLYRIALHASRDHLRASGRRASALPRIDAKRDADELGRESADASQDAARRELVAGLQRALERLPHRLRAAFVLRTFEALEYRDVARVLGITSITARVHVMKARRLLARWLEPWIDGGER